MKSLLIVLLLFLTTGCTSSFSVIGYRGGSVIISCKYDKSKANNKKYFCAETTIPPCKVLINTQKKNSWVHNGRFSLYDNKNSITVVMRDLTRKDEKKYWCGVDISIIRDDYTEVDLSVKDDLNHEMPVLQTVPLGGKTSISCFYSPEHKNSIKLFCREDGEKTCWTQIYLQATYKSFTRGRFSLSDNSGKSFYTLAISDLTEKDAGKYWCSVEKKEDADSYIALITQVVLSVTAPPTTAPALTTRTTTTTARILTTTTTTTTESAPASSDTLSVPTETCSSSSSSSSSSPPSSSSSSSPPSSSSSSGSTTVITIVCVSLAVLLLSLTVMITVYTHRKRKSPGAATFSDGENTNTWAHKDDHRVYEQIAERPLQTDSGTAINSLYSTVNLPTNPSASLHYASVSFHKGPNFSSKDSVSESQDGSCSNEAAVASPSPCVYSTVNVGPAYSTVNHPQASNEDPLYSTVNVGPAYSAVNHPQASNEDPFYSTVSRPKDL